MQSKINIRPGVGMLGLFPSMNYRAWYALGELVDNAIDSYLHNKRRLIKAEGRNYRLRIVIEVDPKDGGFIRVWDDAAGIAAKDYQRAFVTAEPPPDSAGLSQFGIGMKSASCWFAREWRVRSTALDEDVERTIEFDVPAIIRRNLESLQTTTKKCSPSAHFTEVRLWNLYKPPQTQTLGKMRRHLGSMYRQFLRSGEVSIEFNGEAISFEEPKVLVAPSFKDPDGKPREWRRDVDFNLSTGERVTGFVGIRDKGSTREAGLALFRHRRLIVGSDDDTYRPTEIFGTPNSFSYQRVFGELELDDFDVSYTKDAFIWGDRETELLKHLKREIDKAPLPILQQAEGYRAKKASTSLVNAAAKAAAKTAELLPAAEKVIGAQAERSPKEEKPNPNYGKSAAPATIRSTQSRRLSIKGQRWDVTIDMTTDPAATEWLKIRESKAGKTSHELGILLSLSHPFTQRFGGTTEGDIEGLVRLAVGLAIAETTARESGVRMAGVLLRNLNELLGGVLAQDAQ